MVKKRKLPRNIQQVGEWFRYDKQVDGVRRQSKAHFQTPEDAQTALFADLDEYKRSGKWPQRTAPISNPETVAQLYRRWIKWLDGHRSPRHTRDMVGLMGRAFIYGEEYLNLPADQLTIEDVEAWALDWATDLQERGKGRGEVNKWLRYSQTAWNAPWGKRRRATKEYPFNPFEYVERFSTKKEAKYVPTPAEVAALRMAATGEFRLYLDILYETAARPSEALRLTWANVRSDASPAFVVLHTKKTGDGSELPRRLLISPELAAAFVSWRRKQEPGSRYVFRTQDKDTPHNPQWPIQAHRRLCRRAGVKYFPPGCWRHFTASRWAQEGQPLTTIQSRLGHSQATTTNRYLVELAGV